jgi:hypothetical protein
MNLQTFEISFIPSEYEGFPLIKQKEALGTDIKPPTREEVKKEWICAVNNTWD